MKLKVLATPLVSVAFIRELKQRRRRRLGKHRLKNEFIFLLQISRMAGCIQSA